jgi:nicotinamidase-related amidase
MQGCPLPPISPKNTALIIHDMQYDFVKGSLGSKPQQMAEVIGKVRGLIGLARSLSMPVIYTRVETDSELPLPAERAPYLHRGTEPPRCVKGTRDADILDELLPEPNDQIVTKVRSSAFYGTKLEAVLRIKERWIVLIVGGSTNWGVEWLARDAKTRDIVPVVIRDCTYSWTEEAKNQSLDAIDNFIGYVLNADQAMQILTVAK